MEEFTGSWGYGGFKVYIYGMHTQVEYYIIDEPITVYARKYSEAGQLLAGYAKVYNGDGKFKILDEGKFPTNVK